MSLIREGVDPSSPIFSFFSDKMQKLLSMSWKTIFHWLHCFSVHLLFKYICCQLTPWDAVNCLKLEKFMHTCCLLIINVHLLLRVCWLFCCNGLLNVNVHMLSVICWRLEMFPYLLELLPIGSLNLIRYMSMVC